MAKLMWKIPASEQFTKYQSGPVLSMPQSEHQYVGRQLTTANSLAVKVTVEDNAFDLKRPILVEGRNFYYQYPSKSWFVLVDGQ